MEAAKDFLKEQGIIPNISFKDGTPHTVELYKAKQVEFNDQDGQKKAGVEFLVKEEGTPKRFLTASVKLIQELAEYEAGDVVVVQMKKIKDGDGFKSTYQVNAANPKTVTANDDDDIDLDDIPF